MRFAITDQREVLLYSYRCFTFLVLLSISIQSFVIERKHVYHLNNDQNAFIYRYAVKNSLSKSTFYYALSANLETKSILYGSRKFPSQNEITTSSVNDTDIVKIHQSTNFSAIDKLASTVPSSNNDNVMNGEGIKEGHGDRLAIMDAIREFQYKYVFNRKTIDRQFPIGTIIQRTFDTIEDIVIHLRRVPYDYGWIQHPKNSQKLRRTIVVLGSGWAAHAFLKVADTDQLRIIVISPMNHFVFTPMLASAAVGTVEYRSMTEAIRAANPMIDNYIEGYATNIDIVQQTVTVQLNDLLLDVRKGTPPAICIPYDTLIVAVGVKVADSVVPGAMRYSLKLKSCDDARKLRTGIGEALEYASRPDARDDEDLPSIQRGQRRNERIKRATFAIIGGGPTGVELAGELMDFVCDITKPRVGVYRQLKDDIRIFLIHGGSDLVPQFDVRLRQHALEKLTSSGVHVLLNTKVTQLGDGFVKYFSKDSLLEETLYTGLNVWAAGTESLPLVNELLNHLPPRARGPQGKVNVDKWLRCPMPEVAKFGSILVAGDAAAFIQTPSSDEPTTSYLPQTAQVAGQQGAYLARMLDRNFDLTESPPKLQTNSTMMRFWLQLRGLNDADGCLLAYIGGGNALSQIEIGNVPIFSYAGSISFVLWRSVYLVKQVATRNRMLVTFDWLKTFLFGRDITRL